MAVRHERVIVDLDDRFTAKSARMTAATSMFRRELDSSRGTVVAFDKTTRDLSPTIDRLSGRLAILARAGAALGPGLVPIATAAIPAIAGLTTQLGFAVAGAGTAVMAFNGVGDALKAFREAQVEPTEANLAKLREEMAKLGPEARRFVRFLDEIGPTLQGIRETAQAGMLPGVQDGMEALLNRAPQLRRIFGEIADASGDLMRATGEDLASGRWDEFFDFIEAEARPTLTRFGQTIGALTSGLAELWMAFDPLSDDFSGGLLRMAQSFEAWASGLSDTEGFQDFLDYLRQTGPQVVDLLGSLVDMLVQIGAAVAPLGGPTLTILTKLADTIAAIAESDLGTPLFGAVAAMSALSLATRGFASVMESRAVTSVRGMSGDFRAMGDAGIVAWRQSAAEAEKYNAAAGRVKSTLVGMGKAGALVGGMALVTSDLGDKMGVTNTASLALMGTMAGPWGAAIGGAIGLTMDFAAVNDQSADSLDRARQALDDNTLAFEQQKAAVEQAEADLRAYQERARAGGSPFGVNIDDVGDAFGRAGDIATTFFDSLTGHGDEGEAAVRGMREELQAMPGAIQASTQAFLDHKEAIEANIDAMRALREERLRARNAELNYEASIDDARKAAEENGRTLDKTTEKGRANWTALLSLAEGWNGLSDRMQNASGAHRRAIDTFIETAVAMGMEEDKARSLAQRLMEIPPERKTRIFVDAGGALGMLRLVDRELDWVTRPRTARIVITRAYAEAGYQTSGGIQKADGGYISGPGGPRDDAIPAWLSNGEYVVNAAATKRFRRELEWMNAHRYADGGMVHSSTVTNNYGPTGPIQVTGRLYGPNGTYADIQTVVDNRIDANQRHATITGRR